MAGPQLTASNQSPPLQDYNAFTGDAALVRALRAEGQDAFATLESLGALAGSETVQTWARLANENPPKLRTHDRFGNRIDEVEFHPAYHDLMRTATQHGLHAAPWTSPNRDAHLTRAAQFYVWGQAEAGHGCPISMTYASVPALRAQPGLARVWEPLLSAARYDPRLLPATEKGCAIAGMAMTEKQGGSDVRANQTRAARAPASPGGEAYLLTGHKWFCSAPMSDAFLVLAQAERGLTCLLMPRVLPDGSRNRIFIARLKEKLGNRSNASAEIELDDAWALRVGEEGRGLATIVEMVNSTRLDCVNGSAALMRSACALAVHHAMYRHAFGKPLIDHPLMQNVLADLAIESEAAMLLLLRLARATDRSASDPREAALKRLGTAIGKYYVCKRAPAAVAEALECLGGNGYVEESALPRLYREAPLNSIWEGCGNINALDVLRILEKQPETVDALHAEIEPACSDPRLARAASALFASLSDPHPSQARAVAERLAIVWQAALLMHDPRSEAADLFIESRLEGRWGRTLGTLPAAEALRRIALRAAPSVA